VEWQELVGLTAELAGRAFGVVNRVRHQSVNSLVVELDAV
jgi:hypothetical protein